MVKLKTNINFEFGWLHNHRNNFRLWSGQIWYWQSSQRLALNHVLMLAILLLLGFWNMDWVLLGPSFVKDREAGLHTTSKRWCVLAVTAVPIQRCCSLQIIQWWCWWRTRDTQMFPGTRQQCSGPRANVSTMDTIGWCWRLTWVVDFPLGDMCLLSCFWRSTQYIENLPFSILGFCKQKMTLVVKYLR